jgi:RND family efflux transporter MFP subunit
MKMPSNRTLTLLSLVLLGSASFFTACTLSNSDQAKHSPAAESSSQAPLLKTTQVVAECLQRQIRVPAELLAFRDVPIYPKVQGFVQTMRVDRGTVVSKGQVLVEIIAPELEANLHEAEGKFDAARSSLLETQSKIESLVSQKKEAEAKLEADEANYKRILHAAQTVGAIAPSDIEVAEKTVQGDRAHVHSAAQLVLAARSELISQRGRVKASEQALVSMREMESYLTVRAPFDGIISERNVHEGSLVSSSPSNPAMVRIQDTSRLRLLIPVPESAITGITPGTAMAFTVPAFVGKSFQATVSRISHAVDRKTRTMLVEADVANKSGELEPGMYAEVTWEMKRPYNTLFVPSSAVTTIEDKPCVVVIRNNRTEVTEVSLGQTMGTFMEVVGNLREGDQVALQASDDMVSGTPVRSSLISAKELRQSLDKDKSEE